jgi:hypothetical protein
MDFKRAVEDTPVIRNSYRVGLQALRAGDRKYVVPDDTRKLAGSVNVDDALRHRYPNDPRWDYGVAYKRCENHADHVYWIEVHPARTDVCRATIKVRTERQSG